MNLTCFCQYDIVFVMVQEQEVGVVAEVDEGGPRLNQHHPMLGVVMNI